MKKLSGKFVVTVVALVVATAGFVVTNQMIDRELTEASAAGVQIMLKDNKATPNTVTIKVGETVQFNTADGLTHEMGLGEGGDHHEHLGTYSSGDFGAGQAWRVQFKEPGTYTFHDHYHPEINVLVVAYKPSN